MILLRKMHWMLVLAFIVSSAATTRPAWSAEDEAAESGNPLPMTFGIEYTLVTDYVWRGINRSEYRGEGREKINHQFDLGAKTRFEDLGLPDIGALKVGAWFEFYVGNESQNPGPPPAGTFDADNKLQEARYMIAWMHEIPDTPVTVEAGWIAYNFPHASGDAHLTFEIYGKVAVNDGFLFDQDEPILSPTLAYYYDYDLVEAGMLVGTIEHEFALDELVEGTPVIRDITLTPDAALYFDNRYLDKSAVGRAARRSGKSSSFSSVDVGLTAAYDVGKAMDMPEEYGTLTFSVFANYSWGFRRQLLADEFYGGFKVGWKW